MIILKNVWLRYIENTFILEKFLPIVGTPGNLEKIKQNKQRSDMMCKMIL